MSLPDYQIPKDANFVPGAVLYTLTPNGLYPVSSVVVGLCYTAVQTQLVEGTADIGGVTIADGANVALGSIFNVAGVAGGTGTLLTRAGAISRDLESIVSETDTIFVAGDKGVMVLGVRQDNVTGAAAADGCKGTLIINEHGILRTQAQQHRELVSCAGTTGWTVLGNDTDNLATTTNHIYGTTALEFDKVDGAAGTIFAGIQKTIPSVSMAPYHKGGGFFLTSCYLSDITNVAYTFLRLGTDASNYNEWQIGVDNLAAVYNSLRYIMSSPDTIVGNGWDSADVTYVALGVAFLLQNNALEDIAVDHLAVNTGLQVSADIVAEVSSSIATPNINILKVGNKVINLGAGDVGTGTIRMTLSGDDRAVAALEQLVTPTQFCTPFLSSVWTTNIAAEATTDFSAEGTNAGISIPRKNGEVAITLAMIPEDGAFDAYVDVSFLVTPAGTTWDTHAYETLNFHMDGSLATERRLTMPLNAGKSDKIKLFEVKNNDGAKYIDELQVYLSQVI